LLFLGVFPTSVAFTTWAYALARGTAGQVVAMAYLIPPVTILMSWLILGEVPGVVAVLGGAVCVVGVYIARRVPGSSPWRRFRDRPAGSR
jgi:drug/metabolite transporter (DMT)-like permease